MGFLSLPSSLLSFCCNHLNKAVKVKFEAEVRSLSPSFIPLKSTELQRAIFLHVMRVRATWLQKISSPKMRWSHVFILYLYIHRHVLHPFNNAIHAADNGQSIR